MFMRSGPLIIGYDGSPPSEHALKEAAELLPKRRALVVVVWEAGLAFEALEAPTSSVGIPPVPVDIRTGVEVERALYEAAQQMAEKGAALAKEAGLDAEGLAVADEITVAETLVRLARERDAQAVVVGARGHRGLERLLLGSTSEGVVRKAPCPVVVVRAER
jgi:nucleotide-binding universal stress UspA family protein